MSRQTDVHAEEPTEARTDLSPDEIIALAVASLAGIPAEDLDLLTGKLQEPRKRRRGSTPRTV